MVREDNATEIEGSGFEAQEGLSDGFQKLYTVEEFATWARLHKKTVYRLIEDGGLNVLRIGKNDRTARIPQRTIDDIVGYETGGELPLMYTVREIAGWLGEAPKTVYRLIDEKAIPAVQVGKAIRVPQATIDGILGYKSDGLPKLLTVNQMAHNLRLSKKTIYRYGKNGILPNVQVGGAIRYAEDATVAYLEKRGLNASANPNNLNLGFR